MLAILICCLVYCGTVTVTDTSTPPTAPAAGSHSSAIPAAGSYSPTSSGATFSTNNLPSETASSSLLPTASTTLTTTTTTLMDLTTSSSPTTDQTLRPRDRRTRYCYQCSASSADEPCVTDTGGMANISTRDIYIKDCWDSNPKWDRCMIQTVEFGGKLQFFHRDCHDGSYFPKSLDSQRFYNITANNLTTCDLINDKVVCYRPCLGDLCNGPMTYVNKTDYCLEYGDGENENVTLPPGVECGAGPLHFRTGHVTIVVSSLVATFLFGNAIKLLSYL